MLSNHSSSDAVDDDQLVAGEPRQPRIHLARHAVFDGDDVRQFGDPRAQLRAHQIAGVRMAPHRDADVDLLADRLVILVERLVLLVQEVQHRRVHHDIGRADRLGVLGKLDHRIHVLVGAGGDDAGAAADLVDHDLERALALGNRHREELALLAGDEHAVDAEIVDPMPQVPAQALLVDRKVRGKRHQGSSPDALHVGAGVFLGFGAAVFHGFSFALGAGPHHAPKRGGRAPAILGPSGRDFRWRSEKRWDDEGLNWNIRKPRVS